MTERASIDKDRIDDQAVAQRIEDLPPDQAADHLATMHPEDAADVAEYLDPNTAARIMTQLSPEQAADVVEEMESPEAARLLQEMRPDDRVDVLDELPEDKQREITAEFDEPERREVENLRQYPPDTAGGIMTPQVTALYEHLTVGEAIELLRTMNEELEQMFYAYVIDRRGKLVGVLSMRNLILARPNRVLRDIMIPNVRALRATMDQEEVANLFRERKYLAMPVVDEQERLIGLVTLDDVQDVIREEATEDVQKLFGAGAEERLSSAWHFSFRKRVWWLIVNLGTAFMAAGVVAMFEGTVEQLAILAAYMPIIAGMGGNASAQAMAVTVRGLATGRVDKRLLRHVLLREFIVGILTGVVCGGLTFAVAVMFPGSDVGQDRALMLGVVVWLSLAINHTLACTSGSAIPFIMKKLGFDPAQSATIFATTITDVCGFLALLGLASWLLL